jgi:hypothetical protein
VDRACLRSFEHYRATGISIYDEISSMPICEYCRDDYLYRNVIYEVSIIDQVVVGRSDNIHYHNGAMSCLVDSFAAICGALRLQARLQNRRCSEN